MSFPVSLSLRTHALQSPLAKYRCFVSICHVAGGLLSDDNNPTNLPSSPTSVKQETNQAQASSSSVKRASMVTELAILLIHSHPIDHLKAHLDYVAKYRHPTLFTSGSFVYLFVVQLAVGFILIDRFGK